MHVFPVRCSIFRKNESLEEYLLKFLPRFSEKSIVIITSKIVALAQGRVVKNGPRTKANLIKKESLFALKTRYCYLTLTNGHWCANAGIDESNADGNLILWPEHPYEVARSIQNFLMTKFRKKFLGVLITDSRTYPLRAGVTGVALGYAGFKGLRDYRGKPDIFGRKLTMTQTNVADTLASAAVLVMGEGNERCPLALITEAPVVFRHSQNADELRIDLKSDMYRPIFRALERKNFLKKSKKM